MKRVIIYCHDKGATWRETYDEGAAENGFPFGTKDPEAWARALVAKFNNTLRPNETWRTVDRVEVTEIADPNYRPDHVWRKTNAVTISDRQGVYDRMQCEVCGVTGKRFGLTYLRIDSKFKAARFKKCRAEERVRE